MGIRVENCGMMWIVLLKPVESSKLIPHFKKFSIVSYLVPLVFSQSRIFGFQRFKQRLPLFRYRSILEEDDDFLTQL